MVSLGPGSRVGSRERTGRGCMPQFKVSMEHLPYARRRGIFITGSSLMGAAQRVPRITSKNLIRQVWGEPWEGAPSSVS